ncbi:MAG TPA: ATP synthase F1 subunit delta [Terriglobales bacterium]|nr:ATP synthase F1 subunit delta [Terriglobales bacterium]
MALIDERYARALLDLAATGGAEAERLRPELAQCAALVEQSRELRAVLASPAVARERKLAVLEILAQRLGLSRWMRNFLAVAAVRGRAGRLPAIAAAFERLWREQAGIRRAQVFSARPLVAEERAAIEQALAAATAARIEASYQEDAALIGGFTARVGDVVYDGSLRGRLDRLRHELTTP